jgi:hypothetical protein
LLLLAASENGAALELVNLALNIRNSEVLFMARYRLLPTLFVVAFTTISLPLLARPHAETWIAWVSDQACGAKHTESGHADCIRKCIRGGAGIGHPEWKAQPPVLVKESDRSVWIIDNPSSLNGLEGQKVRADVEIDASKKAVHVKRAVGASQRKP